MRDIMWDFPDLNFPVGEWINVGVEWLTQHLAALFDVITIAIREPLIWIKNDVLLWLPWWVVIIIITAIAWKIAGWKIAVLAVVGLFFIGAMAVLDPWLA